MIKIKLEPSGKGLEPPKKCKYRVPEHMMFAEFSAKLRVNGIIKVGPSQTVFFIINKTLPVATSTMAEIHKLAGHPDVLTIRYELENSFG